MKREFYSMKLAIQNLLTDTRLLKRLIIALGALLVVSVIGFGGYYYYDRFYSAKPKAMDLTIQKAEQDLIQDPGNNEKRMDLAQLYLVNNRITDAIRYTNQVLLSDPNNQRGWLVLGLSYALKGEPASAIEPLQKYYDANKESDMPGLNRSLQSAAYYLGDSYFQLGKTDQAVEPLENAVRWSKTDADAMYKLGQVYTTLKKYDDALQMFTYATAFVPDFQEAYEGMAKVFTQTQNPDLFNYAQGMVAFSKKDYKTAIDLLLKSAQAKSDFAPTFAGLGLTYEASGDLQKSIGAYEAALKLDQNNLTAQQGRQRVEVLINKK
jgi:tetratricopeptide (TPR) repeat protein